MSRAHPVRLSALACALVLAASSCSLLDLDDFGVEPCRRDSDCAAANEAEGIDAGAQCVAYQCNTENGLCELTKRDRDHDGSYDRELCEGSAPEHELDCADGDDARSPRKAEECDGIDNDCDLTIDEGVWPKEEPRSARVGETDELSMALSPDGTALVALTRRGPDTEPASGLIVRAQPGEAIDDVDPGCGLPGGCNFEQIALATRDEQVAAVGINRRSCRDGQARVGLGKVSSTRYDLGLRSPEASTNQLVAGIDLGGARLCTATTGACEGARSPAIALLPPAGNPRELRALALWLARDERCDEADASGARFSLVGLGLRVDPSQVLAGLPSPHSRQLWSGLTFDQRPSLLGFADAASGQAGHLIAHIDERGPLLLFVPSVGSTSEITATMAGSLDDPGATQVALAVLPAQDLRGLALAWRSRDAGLDVIRFAALQLHPDTHDGVQVQVRGEIATWPVAAQLVGGPALAYAPEGFAAEDPAGGWLLLWSERVTDTTQRLLAVRLAEARLDMRPQPEELAHGELAHIFAYPRRTKVQLSEHAVIRYGFVHGSMLSLGEASCFPR